MSADMDMSVEAARKQFRETINFLKFGCRRNAHKKGYGHKLEPPTSNNEFVGVPEPMKWTDHFTEAQIQEMAKDCHP